MPMLSRPQSGPRSRSRSIARPLGLLGALLGLGLWGAACDGAPGSVCRVNGVSHRVGDTFPDSDGCNTCSCTAGGAVACTARACIGDAGLPSDRGDSATCDFANSYEYGSIGGFRASEDRSFISPGNQYRHTRTLLFADASPELSCSPEMPPCGAQDLISAYDIEVHDLPLPDVQSALGKTTPPLYGIDTRPVDGSVFEFKRADGRGFLVGAPCDATTAACTPIPAGIAQLKQRLLDLDTQQLSKPGCEAFVAR